MNNIYNSTTYNQFMSTCSKGLNAVKSTFKPLSCDYRLFRFYTSLISRVFILFH